MNGTDATSNKSGDLGHWKKPGWLPCSLFNSPGVALMTVLSCTVTVQRLMVSLRVLHWRGGTLDGGVLVSPSATMCCWSSAFLGVRVGN